METWLHSLEPGSFTELVVGEAEREGRARSHRKGKKEEGKADLAWEAKDRGSWYLGISILPAFLPL